MSYKLSQITIEKMKKQFSKVTKTIEQTQKEKKLMLPDILQTSLKMVFLFPNYVPPVTVDVESIRITKDGRR